MSDGIVNQHTMGLIFCSKKIDGEELHVPVAGQPVTKLLLMLDFSACNAFEFF